MGAYNPAGGSQFMNLSQVSVSQKGAAISAYGTEPTCRDEAPMSAFGAWVQPIDATPSNLA